MRIAKKLKQTAVYWGGPTPDGRGKFTFDSPVEIRCRWEEKQELFQDFEGNEQISRAVLYYDQDVELEAYVYLGELTDFDSSVDLTNPEQIDDAWYIGGYDKSPNLRNNQSFYKIWLVKRRER